MRTRVVHWIACVALSSVSLAAPFARADDEADDLAGFAPTEPDAAAQAEPPAPSDSARAAVPSSVDDALGFASDQPAPALEASPAPEAKASPAAAASHASDTSEPSSLVLTGFYRGELGLWATRTGNSLAKLRQSVDASLRYVSAHVRLVAGAHLEYDPAYLYRRGEYDRATLDNYELVTLGGETYLALSSESVELVVGRQIVSWGEADLLSVVDLVNPRDLREPGQADLDDLRIAVLASRLGWFAGGHRVELMAVHEASFGLRPPPLASYSPLRAALLEEPSVAQLLADKELSYEDVPKRFSAQGQQLYARYGFRGPGADFAFYAASTDYREGVIRLPSASELATRTVVIALEHPRYTVLGHSAAVPLGPFVVKWELAASLSKPFNVGTITSLPPAVAIARYDAAEAMLGISYQAPSQLQLGLEVQKTTIVQGPNSAAPPLLLPVEATSVALRVAQTLLHERVQLSAIAVTLGDPRRTGWFARSDVTLSVKDSLKVGVGYVTYHGGDRFGPLYGFRANDRVFVRLRRDFDLM